MLSATEIEFFRDQGYLLLGRVLEEERVDALRALAEAELERVRHAKARSEWDLLEHPPAKAGGAPPAIFRLSRVMARNPAFEAVARDPRITSAARSLLGAPAALCVNRHNMMVVKAPRVGRPIAWHQDGLTWDHPGMLSFMLFLDAAMPENGCLEIIPGVHRRGFLSPMPGTREMDLSDPAQAALARQAVPIRAQPGEGLFFHSCTPHGSKANASERYRRNLVFAYVARSETSMARTGISVGRTGMPPLEVIELPAA